MSQTCTTKDAARILGVTPRTVQLWSESGILDYWRTPGGHRRYDLEKIQALSAQNLVSSGSARSQPSPVAKPELCKVLVIEDDSVLLNLYNINISSWGLPVSVELSQDGYDGLLKIGSLKPDILILDLTLPSVDGFQIIGTLLKNKLLARMKLLVVSGMSESEIAQNLDKIDDIKVMTKPVNFAAIRAEVENCLAQMSSVSP